MRFEVLLEIVDTGGRPFSITDYGCGYGALVEYLEAHDTAFSYQGFDVSAPLLEHARTLHAGSGRTFVGTTDDLKATDFAVASGVFNVKQESDVADWSDYVVASLRQVNAIARRGFSFNMLTSYSDADRMRADLYYGDPCAFFDLCKREFSRHVALRHDYGLWEFTILVRKEPYP